MSRAVRTATVALITSFMLSQLASAGNGDTSWMLKAKYGIFLHYQYKKQDLTRFTPENTPAQEGILWHGKIYCGNIYHGQGDANQFDDQELIDWIKTCNRQAGVCTLDWPFDPETGLLKDFGMAQLKRISQAVKGTRKR